MYLQDYHWTKIPGYLRLVGPRVKKTNGRESHRLATQDKNRNKNKEQAINITNETAHQSPTRHAYFGDLVLIYVENVSGSPVVDDQW